MSDGMTPAAEQRYLALSSFWRANPPLETIRMLGAHLRDEDSAIRALAARLLRNVGEQHPELISSAVATALEAGLTDADPDVRYEAVRALLVWAPATAQLYGVLTPLLGDAQAHPALLAALVRALPRFAKVLPVAQLALPLGAMLSHNDAELRDAVVQTLTTLAAPWPEDAPPVETLVDDEDPFVRESAVRWIAAQPELLPVWREAVTAATSDHDDAVAEAARQALSR